MDDDFNLRNKFFKTIDKEKDLIIKKNVIKESLKPSYLRITKSPLTKKIIYPSKNKKNFQNNISVNLNYLNITLDKLPYKNPKNLETIETSFKDKIQTDNYLLSKSTILERNPNTLSNSYNSTNSNGYKLNKKDNNNFISFNEEFTPEKKEEIMKKIKKSKEDFSNECNIIDNIFYDSPSENGNNIIQLMATKLIKNTIFSKYLNNNSSNNNKIQNEKIRDKKYKNLIEKVKIKNIGIFPDNLFYNYNNISELINDDNDIIFPYSFIKKSLFRNFMKKIKKGMNKNEKIFHRSLTKNKINIPRNYLHDYFSVTPKKNRNKFLSIISDQNSLEKIYAKKTSLRTQINETDWDNYSDIYEPLPTARGPYKGRKNSNQNKMNLSDLNININDSYNKNKKKKTHLKTNSVAISPKNLKHEKQKLNISIINNTNNLSFIKQINYTSINNRKDVKKRNKMNKNIEKYYTFYDRNFKNNINNNNNNQDNILEPFDLQCMFIKSPNEIIKIIKNYFKKNDCFLNIKGNQIKCIQANTHIELNIVKLPYFNNGFYLKIKLKNWVNSQDIINELLNLLNK